MQDKDAREEIGLLKFKIRELRIELKEMRRSIEDLKNEIENVRKDYDQFKLSIIYSIMNRKLYKLMKEDSR